MLAVGTHEEFLNDLTVHVFDETRKPKELRLHEVVPLDAKFRAEIGDCKTAAPDIFRYGICTTRCYMAPTLRKFNRLGDLRLVCAPLLNERWIVSPPVARPDNARFPPPEVKTRIPFKKKKKSMNI